MAFVAGKGNYVTFTPTGQGAAATIYCREHSWKDAIDKVDVTDARHGGVEALLLTIIRGQGNFTFFWNTTDGNPTAAAVGMVAGTGGVVKFLFNSTTNFYQAPASVLEVLWKSSVPGGVEVNANLNLNRDVGAYTQALQ